MNNSKTLSVALSIIFLLGIIAMPMKTQDKTHEISHNIKNAVQKTIVKPTKKEHKNIHKRDISYKHKTVEHKKVKPKPSFVPYDVPIGAPLQKYIHVLCKKYGIKDKVVYGIMKTESDYDPTIISSTGDWGIMQVNIYSQSKLLSKMNITPNELLNPYYNVKVGVRIISKLIHKYGYNKAIIAYHEGITGMYRTVDAGIYSTDYSRKVVGAMTNLTSR